MRHPKLRPWLVGAAGVMVSAVQAPVSALSAPAMPAPVATTSAPASVVPDSTQAPTALTELSPMLTLAEALERARSSPAAASAAALARAASADRDQAQWALYPRAALGYNRDTNRTFTDQRDEQTQLTVSYTLFDGGRARGNLKEKDAQAQAQVFTALSKSDQVALSAVQAYLDVLRYTRLAEIAHENIERHQYVRNLIAQIASIDRGRRSDLSLVDSRLAVARKTYANYLQQKGTAATQFEQLIGQPPANLGLPVLAPERRVNGITPEIEDRIDDYSPDVKAAKQTLEAAEGRVDASRHWYVPDVIVQAIKPVRNGGQYYTPSREWYGGMQLQWDTTDRLSGVSALRAAEERRASAEQDIEAAQRALHQKAADLFNVLASVRERHASSGTQVQSLDQVSEAYWDQFTIGRRSLLDALNTQSDLFVSRTEDASLSFDELLLQMQIFALQGMLDEEVRALSYMPLGGTTDGSMRASVVPPPLHSHMRVRREPAKPIQDSPGVEGPWHEEGAVPAQPVPVSADVDPQPAQEQPPPVAAEQSAAAPASQDAPADTATWLPTLNGG
jgi:adhesin transport system outer membrane protein